MWCQSCDFVHVGFSVLVWIEVDVSFPQFDLCGSVWGLCVGSGSVWGLCEICMWGLGVCGVWVWDLAVCGTLCLCWGCGGTCQRKTSGVLLCHCAVFLWDSHSLNLEPGWQLARPTVLLSLLPTAGTCGHSCSFTWLLKIWTQFLMLAEQALLLLSHLPRIPDSLSKAVFENFFLQTFLQRQC